MATTAKTRPGKVLPAKTNALAAGTLPASNPLISHAKLQQLYAKMLECRLLTGHMLRSSKAAKGRAAFGGEAVIAGAAIDLREDDWLACAPGDMLGPLLKGATLASILSGPETSNARPRAWKEKAAAPGKPTRALRLLKNTGDPIVQLHRAAGLALAVKAAGGGNLVMAFFDATPKFDQRWRDALAFAGEHCLPLLLVMHSKAPRASRSVANGRPFESLLSAGRACEVPVIPVDAEDVVAVYRVAYESIHKARSGGGPTLIQAVTFPVSGTKGAIRGGRSQTDSISRMEAHLASKGLFTPAWKQKLVRSFQRDLDATVERLRGRKRSGRA